MFTKEERAYFLALIRREHQARLDAAKRRPPAPAEPLAWAYALLENAADPRRAIESDEGPPSAMTGPAERRAQGPRRDLGQEQPAQPMLRATILYHEPRRRPAGIVRRIATRPLRAAAWLIGTAAIGLLLFGLAETQAGGKADAAIGFYASSVAVSAVLVLGGTLAGLYARRRRRSARAADRH